MTQDGDDDNDDDDKDDDIEVYEDERDMLGLGDFPNHGHEHGHYYLQEQGRPLHGQLLPKDQPRPGIESDGDDDDDDDDEDYIGHTFGGQRQHLSGTQNSHDDDDDEDESMSDSENLDPLPLSLFEDNNAEDEEEQQQDQQQQQQRQDEPQEEEHHSDLSSQPSEYPSTRRPWRLASSGTGVAAYKTSAAQQHGQDNQTKPDHDDNTGISFKIHEDGDATNM